MLFFEAFDSLDVSLLVCSFLTNGQVGVGYISKNA